MLMLTYECNIDTTKTGILIKFLGMNAGNQVRRTGIFCYYQFNYRSNNFH